MEASSRERLDIPAQVQGALITEVVPGSRAETAGLKAGHVVLEINRKAVISAAEAASAISAADGSVVMRVRTKEGILFLVAPAPK